MNKIKLLPAFLFLPFVLSSIALGYFPSAEDWRDQTFYMIMIDRFNNGDTTNDNYNSNDKPYSGTGVHGGDIKGVTQKLDYLKSLGITAIWLSPVSTNDGQYHGYAAVNFKEVDPRIGTMEDLQNLIKEAHKRGIYVFLDIICNHMGYRITTPSDKWNYPTGYPLSWKDTTKKYYPPLFDNLSVFHNYGNIEDFKVQTQSELGSLRGLNDIRTEDTTIQNELIDIYKWWIQQTDCDGYRIDTFKHINIEFWQAFCPAIREYAASLGKKDFLMYGETVDSNAKCGYYTGTKAGGPYVLKSILFYPMYWTILDVFARDKGTQKLDNEYSQLTCYDPTTWNYLPTFLDNHDRPRFLSTGLANYDYSKLKLALTFILTSRGIPIIYYGTEQGFYGDKDTPFGNGPYCREDMFAGQYKDPQFAGQDSFNTNFPLFQFTSTMLYLRNNYAPLRRGTFTSRWNTSTTAGIYAFSRIYDKKEIVVMLNTAMTSQISKLGDTGLETTFPKGTVLTNLLDSKDTITVGENGVGGNQISVKIPAQSIKILTVISQNYKL